jgi:predicted helicase
VRLLVQSADFAEARQSFRLCSTNQWNYDSAKDYLRRNSYEIQTCRFRPFDDRRTIFSRHVVSILRERVMAQFDHDNVALVVSRVANDGRFAHAFVTDGRTDKIFLSSSTSTNAYVFPLYIYSPRAMNEQTDIFGDGRIKISNLSERCIREWSQQIDLRFVERGEGDRRTNFGPEDILFYIYAVLYSTTYRELNDADLRGDFPRIPAPKHRELFIALCEQGRSLVNAHLLRAVGDLQTRYPSPGSNRVERVRFERERLSGAGQVWINRDQSFTNISEVAWNFRVGKYYPIRKWLTERRGRILQFEDIEHYRRVSWAIHQTINWMSEIDAIIEDAGGLV